jgi:hypothetical protein
MRPPHTSQCHALALPPASPRWLYILEHLQLDTNTDTSSNTSSIRGPTMHANQLHQSRYGCTPPSRYKYWWTVHAGRVLLDTIPAKTAQKRITPSEIPKHSKQLPWTQRPRLQCKLAVVQSAVKATTNSPQRNQNRPKAHSAEPTTRC